jgi:protein tyrosine/serine phosphatase
MLKLTLTKSYVDLHSYIGSKNMFPNLKRTFFSLLAVSFIGLSNQATCRAGNVPTEMEGLLNFHEVHPYLYRGGAPDEASLKKLKEKGVQTIIDLRAPSEMKVPEKKLVKELGMNYINLPMASQAPTKAQLKTFDDEVEKAQKKESGPVFVHCAHGSDRTGCLVGIWRVSHEGWSYDKAYEEMHKYFFGPKFTALSGAVRQAAKESASTATAQPAQ